MSGPVCYGGSIRSGLCPALLKRPVVTKADFAIEPRRRMKLPYATAPNHSDSRKTTLHVHLKPRIRNA
jgi:hypothetical protein